MIFEKIFGFFFACTYSSDQLCICVGMGRDVDCLDGMIVCAANNELVAFYIYSSIIEYMVCMNVMYVYITLPRFSLCYVNRFGERTTVSALADLYIWSSRQFGDRGLQISI